jgi:hypothetical protein
VRTIGNRGNPIARPSALARELPSVGPPVLRRLLDKIVRSPVAVG